ncbi:MAG: hypothetical protein P9L88_07510 [Candidatus Tantalella remota]|nr:hypothetical protein [Candidatus Tantalella remota]
MNKIITKLVCILILAASCPAFAYEDVDKTEYVGRDTEGGKRWESETEIRQKEGDVYILTEKGEGVYSSFDGQISWETKLEFASTKENVLPLKLVKRVFDSEGSMIRLEKQDYNPEKNTVTCLHEDIPRNISRTKKFTFTKDAVNRQLLGLYTQKMLENGKRLAKIQMVSEEPGVYNVDLRVIKTENVEINGRQRRAFKLQLDPRLGFLNVAKVFFPKAYYWHSASPDFEWLRYEGLEGDIKSSEVEVTVVD